MFNPSGEATRCKKFYYIVIIIERFPNSHENDSGNPLAGVPLCGNNLREHFRGQQTTGESSQCRCAKGTSHRTARFCGNTDGVPMPYNA